MKVIIWGYPLYSHTHSYIHAAFYKAFQYLGHEVYWFDDNNHPSPVDFSYKDCLFWTEGFADKKIPLEKSSIYFVHVCPNPLKYLSADVKKFVDVRYNHIWHKDHVYSYSLSKSDIAKVGPCCYFDSKSKDNVQVINDYHNYSVADYDKFYITWASNMLPHEFNGDDIFLPRENSIYFSGNLSGSGRCENLSQFEPFIRECKKNNINFVHNDPFSNPLSEEEVIIRAKKSLLGLDIRGPEHIRNGYVPCRVFKSISYGHLGMTNSKEVYSELDGNCILEDNTGKLFYSAMSKKSDYSFIRKSMEYVRENHTYINRINSIMSIL